DFNRVRLSWEELQKRRQEQETARQRARRLGTSIAGLNVGDLPISDQEEGAEPVHFALDQKLTLPRQRSALLPVLTKEIEAKSVSIFNEKFPARHPLEGVELKNKTGQALMHGPVSVFEGTTYRGDARLPHLQPDEDRLISYALDVGVEVKATQSS